MCKQTAEMIWYLHTSCIVHRDIKTENILLNSHCTNACSLKLCDFGFARVCGANESCYTVIGTPCYMAPEIHALKVSSPSSSTGYSLPVDMWSCGVLIYAIHALCLPFDGEDLSDTIMKGYLTFEEEDWKNLPRISRLVRLLLKVTPSERLSAKNMIQDMMV